MDDDAIQWFKDRGFRCGDCCATITTRFSSQLGFLTTGAVFVKPLRGDNILIAKIESTDQAAEICAAMGIELTEPA